MKTVKTTYKKAKPCVIFDMDGLMFDTERVFIKACALLGDKPEVCIALEDSKNGLLSAYNAGCKVIMVPDLWQPDEETLKVISVKYESLEQVKNAFEHGEI